MGCCGCVDTVDCIGRNVNRTLETECHIRSINIIVDGLWQMDDVQSLFTQQICCFLCSVSPEDHQAVQTQFVVILLHGLYLVQSVFIRCTHQLERLSGCSKDRSALCQDSRKIFCRKHTVIAVDQTFVSIIKSINFEFLNICTETFDYSSHCCIECLTVTAACQHTNS